VLLPLCELAPHISHASLGATISQILANVKDDKKVILLPPS